MDLGLKGKSVLITGASKGIGRATAEAFAREGADEIHITARSGDALDEAARTIEAARGCRVHSHALDLTDRAARDELIAKTIDVDILVNNAGAIPSGSMDAVDDDAWRAGWELKVFGYITMCRAFFARMRERGHGVIVNDVGNSGENPDFDYIAGSCGNSSLMTLTRALGGRSLDHGIRVVAVNPGPVDTAVPNSARYLDLGEARFPQNPLTQTLEGVRRQFTQDSQQVFLPVALVRGLGMLGSDDRCRLDALALATCVLQTDDIPQLLFRRNRPSSRSDRPNTTGRILDCIDPFEVGPCPCETIIKFCLRAVAMQDVGNLIRQSQVSHDPFRELLDGR